MTNQQLSIKLFNESIAMRHDGNYIEAINLQKQSIETYPDDPDIAENYYSLGKTYYLAGDYKKAVDCYKVYNGLCVIKTPVIVRDYNAYLTGDIAATHRFMSSYANLARNTGYAFRNMSSGKGPGDWDIWYRYMLMGKDPNSMPNMAKYKRDNIENDERATQDGMFVISTWFKEFSSDFYKTKQVIIDLATDIVQTKDNISVENTYRASDKIIAEYEAKIKELTGLLQQSQAAYEKAENKNREYEAQIKKMTELLQSNKASKQVYTFDHNNHCIPVIGSFSTGKSTVINALMGQRILVSSKMPSTLFPTLVKYGSTDLCTIFFTNGNKISTSFDKLNEYLRKSSRTQTCSNNYTDIIKEQDKLLNSFFNTNKYYDYNQIKYILVASPKVKENIEFIDCPGMSDFGDYYGKNKDLIDLFNKKYNTVIFVANPLDYNFTNNVLHQLADDEIIENIIVVCNFKDNYEDHESIIRKTMTELIAQPYFRKKSIKIFFVSSMQALLYKRHKNGEQLPLQMLKKLPTSYKETGFDELEKYLDKLTK